MNERGSELSEFGGECDDDGDSGLGELLAGSHEVDLQREIGCLLEKTSGRAVVVAQHCALFWAQLFSSLSSFSLMCP